MVVAVIALAVTLLVPRLEAVERASVDAAARRLADAIGFGRARAVLTGAPMRLALDLDASRWVLGRPGREPGAVAPADAAAAPPLGPPVKLPAGVRLRAVTAGGAVAVRAGVVVLDFQPEGDAFPVRVELGDGHGHAAAVLVPPAGGRALVVTEGRS